MRGSAGFTLLEVLVALAILSTAVVIVLQLFSANIRMVLSSEEYVAAAAAGEVKMRELLESGTLSEPKTWSESTDDGYRMDVSVSEILKTRTENLPVKLLHIDLTVNWKTKMFDKSIKLNTIKMADKEAAGARTQRAGG